MKWRTEEEWKWNPLEGCGECQVEKRRWKKLKKLSTWHPITTSETHSSAVSVILDLNFLQLKSLHFILTPASAQWRHGDETSVTTPRTVVAVDDDDNSIEKRRFSRSAWHLSITFFSLATLFILRWILECAPSTTPTRWSAINHLENRFLKTLMCEIRLDNVDCIDVVFFSLHVVMSCASATIGCIKFFFQCSNRCTLYASMSSVSLRCRQFRSYFFARWD